MGELLTLHSAARDMTTVIFRPHNVYGPDMGNEHVIPELTNKLLRARAASPPYELEIQGDGSQTRAFCFVADAAKGAVLAGTVGEHKSIYNVGVDEETDITSVALQIGKVLNLPFSFRWGYVAVGETDRRCPDVSKLRALGYKPRFTLEEGLQLTVDWYTRFFEGHA
jgi:nucleoside-diphosphate-sugar epimerase